MLSVFLFTKLITVAASLFMATAVYGRDPGHRINRLMSAVMLCTAWWAGCEVAWTLQRDPAIVVWIVRVSSLGWLLVGPFLFDIFVELAGRYRSSRLAGARPWVHRSAVLGLALYVLTPWCLEDVVPTAWGFGFRFGPLFAVPFAVASLPPTLVLLGWRHLHPTFGSAGERTTSALLWVSAAAAVVMASATDAGLPMLGVQVPPLGSTTIMLVGLVAAYRLRRYGYSLLSAGAFAEEILAALDDGVVLMRADGRIRACNPAFAGLVGRPRESLRGELLSGLASGLPEPVGELQRPCEALIHRDQSAPLPVLVSRPVVCATSRGVLGMAVVVRDVREITDMRDRLIRSARLASVGDLSVGIAEGIMRPVLAARLELDRLSAAWSELGEQAAKSPCDAPEVGERLVEGRELLAECIEGVERIAAIARDVRGFAGGGDLERHPLRVSELVETAIRVAAPQAGPGVVVLREIDDVPEATGSQPELEQVLVNLLVNAFHAVGDAGEVMVRAESRDGLLLIHVRDDGPGIEPGILDRIFDPFFTTKPVGEGTGLGLAICYHIVRNHGGEIRVATREGAGTTFTVELPLR